MKSELKVSDENYDVIQAYASGIQKLVSDMKGKENWTEEGEETFKIEFLKKEKVIGSITLHDKELVAVGDVIIQKLKDLIAQKEELDKKKLTPEKVRGKLLKEVLNQKDSFNGLADNPIVFEILNKSLEELNLKGCLIEKRFTENDSIKSEPTILLNSSFDVSGLNKEPKIGLANFKNALIDFLYKNYPHNNIKKEEFKPAENFLGFLTPLSKESIKEILLGGQLIGHYLPERNLITIYFNPFSVKKILPLETELPEIWVELLKALKDISIKVQDTNLLMKKMFINTFMTGTKHRSKVIEEKLKIAINDISSYETELQNRINLIDGYKTEEVRLGQILSSQGEVLFAELEKVERLPFIEKADFEPNSLILKFRPTSIIIPEFTRIDYGKSYGKRTIFLGSITATIKPDLFNMVSDYPFKGGHAHPHVNTDGKPCFGDGPGRNKIYELLAGNMFSDLAKMLWFYLKTYRLSGAYIKHWELYDDRLSKGLPVWDEKGKLIAFEDPERIKTGEQKEGLKKHESFKENIEKFKDTIKPII